MNKLIINSCILIALIIFLAPISYAEIESTPIEIGKSYKLDSKILSLTHEINVYFPASYNAKDDKDELLNKSYPVVYLIDGGVEQDFIHIAGIANLAADYRNIREFILVGVETIKRRDQLTHPSQVADEIKHVPNHGGSAKFMQFLGQEVKPFVSQNLRVTDESILMGESLGALFTLEVLAKKPALFSGYAAISPSLWWNGQELAKGMPKRLKEQSYQGKKLYLTIADEGGDMREGVDLYAQAIADANLEGFSWKYEPMENKTHGTIFHPAALEAIHFLLSIKPFKEFQKAQHQE